jgi:predicted DCC family thiol-disulfide oxidoreductase YuxK
MSSDGGCGRAAVQPGDEGKRKDEQVSLFYDGKCPVCAYEVGHYQRLDRDKERIRFLDINDDRVQGELAKRGLTFDDAMARMYVETKDGRLVEGVESFVQVWQELPYWRHLVPLARVPGVTWVMHRAYTVWARNRMWLTGRQNENAK